jgi:hypothetical protein
MCLGHESAGLIVQLGSNIAAKSASADEATTKLASGNADGGKAQAGVGSNVLRLGDRVAVSGSDTQPLSRLGVLADAKARTWIDVSNVQ